MTKGQEVTEQRLTGERALFGAKDLLITNSIFEDGESPLKESENIHARKDIFGWKYPFWYGKHILIEECMFAEMARAGIWYTDDVTVTDTLYEAAKGFRRIDGLHLRKVQLTNAEETLWHCNNVTLEDVTARGDYFGMNCENMVIREFQLSGNYAFDGCKNLEVHHAKLLSKDAFWNCEKVTVYDSYISGEYLGWNSKNIRFINCTIESLQGLCYIENLVLENCSLINTTLAFEYSSVDATVCSKIDSVKNPISGRIKAKSIGELFLEQDKIDPAKTEIITEA